MRDLMYYGLHPTGNCYGFFESAGECKNPVKLTLSEYNKLFADQSKGMQIVADKNGKPYTAWPEDLLTAEEKIERKASEVRAKRDVMLTESDKNVIIDRWQSMTTEEQTKWANYRKYLRDLPTANNFPNVDVLTFEQFYK